MIQPVKCTLGCPLRRSTSKRCLPLNKKGGSGCFLTFWCPDQYKILPTNSSTFTFELTIQLYTKLEIKKTQHINECKFL